MKLSFFGSSLVSAYWNGAATYYRGIIRSLHARGHQVTFYEPNAYDRQRHRDIADPDWAEVVVYEPEPAVIRQMLRRASGSDVAVKCSGVGVFDAYLEAGVLEECDAGATVFWDVDAPATLDRVNADTTDPFRTLIPAYDAIFTYGGGDAVEHAYLRLGARRCVAVYNAVDPETHFRVPSDGRFKADLAFLGNRLPDREARVDTFFFEPARRLPDRRFLIGGSGWEHRPLPDNVRRVGHVYTGDHNAFNAGALAVMNINRDSMARYGSSPATRIFEAAGAGACIITDHFRGVETFLTPGKEVLVARSPADVVRHVEGLTPGRARRIGGAAQRRVLMAHTYAHRAAQIEAELMPRPAPSRAPATPEQLHG